MRCLRAYAAPAKETLQQNVKHVEEVAQIRNAPKSSLGSATSSRRTSLARSTLTSLGANADPDDESNDTFASASASYHSQTVERTDMPNSEGDNSSCVSFEDDSQPIVHYPVEISANTPKDLETAACIDQFLDKYLIDTATIEVTEETTLPAPQVQSNGLGKDMTDDNILVETGRDLIAMDTLQGRWQEAVNNITNTLSRCTKSYEIHGSSAISPQDVRNMDALIARSPSEEIAFDVPKDPFLSPYWASDDWLSQLPETKILTLNMDPCLDDCVMFAKKLKRLGRQVNLEILEGLPHGFLNFTMLSNEAMDGSKHCIKSLQALLQIT
ncbi:hormone-sensitive lipase [Drosophila madeirensis]